MKRNNYIKYGLLLVFLFITFFNKKVYAANFRYADFNEEKWEEILKENKRFWVSGCKDDEDCVDEVLKTKKKFYIRLYELLAQAESVGHINDNYIIATVFFGLNPDTFRDPDEYAKYNPYKIDEDESTKNKYVGSIDQSELSAAQDYFDKETDSLKTLVNAFIGYDAKCFGISNVEVKKDENGNLYCDNGLTVISSGLFSGNKCGDNIENYKGTFWDSIALPIFKTENQEKCEDKSKEKGYNDSVLITSDDKQVNEEFYWEFLKSSNYFDKKDHLYSYFRSILDRSGYDSMIELEKDEKAYKKYKKDIINVREKIIENIKSIIESYGEEFNNLDGDMMLMSTISYWWPIGGKEIKHENGKDFAVGDPTSTTITSNFGGRADPMGRQSYESHKGLDIGGTIGSTVVIAAQSGTVVSSAPGITGSCVIGDTSCGGGYGNYIIIQHGDGNYTLYGHMDTNSIKVKEGDVVKQGQVIGLVGSTGSSTGGHLHFEIRVGNNAGTSTTNPLEYVDPSNPRPTGANVSLQNGGNNQQTICKTLISSKMSQNGVAALLTNINAESGFNPNIVGDYGTSYGLCQWHNERWDNLKNQFPNNWQKIDGQLQYLLNELHGGYSSLYESLMKGSESGSTLAYNFCSQFERPANTFVTCRNRANSSNSFISYVKNGCE